MLATQENAKSMVMVSFANVGHPKPVMTIMKLYKPREYNHDDKNSLFYGIYFKIFEQNVLIYNCDIAFEKP